MGLNVAQKQERSEYLEANLNITECSQKKPYTFISYASDNWETVFKSVVVPLQKQYGLRVYADKAFDKVNDKWIVPMLRNVRGADMMIVFISQSYIESYACFLELLTAVNSKKQIVFVSLGEQLHLGDTTDLPNLERGAKNEILNQGSNLATNTNNTSNDIMRAMKSAYTSLSTLLEQDALSKYDISDAFINFFRDSSINQKTARDLGAVRGTIESISEDVFDLPQTASPVPVMEPAAPTRTQPWERLAEDSAAQIPFAGAEPVSDAKEVLTAHPEAAQGKPSPAQPEAKASASKRHFFEALKSSASKFLFAGLAIGILSVALFVIGIRSDSSFDTGMYTILSLMTSVIGLYCSMKNLKLRKGALSVIALILNGFIPAIFLLFLAISFAMGGNK